MVRKHYIKKGDIIMKKILAVLLALAMMILIVSCNKEPKPVETTESVKETTPVDDPSKKSEGVMTYAQYAAADLDTKVVVETYVQDKQSWWADKATVYTQDLDGAYFLYNMACSEADYAKLTPGTKIRVEGYKSAWAGEVEITDATFTILEGKYVAEPKDVTAMLGKDELITKQNQLVSFKGLTVEDYDGNGAAFAYKNAVDKTDDLYFKVSLDGQTYGFCVEFYLRGKDTDVYKAVEALKVGQKVDLEGFLYWYNGVNPHITSVKVVG